MIVLADVLTGSTANPLSAIDVSSAELMSKFFRGLGDPGRVRILQLLLGGDKNVGELALALGLAQGRISTHLSCLRWCGFVTSYRQGKFVYYRVTDPSVRQLIELAQVLINRNGMQLASCNIIGELERHPMVKRSWPGLAVVTLAILCCTGLLPLLAASLVVLAVSAVGSYPLLSGLALVLVTLTGWWVYQRTRLRHVKLPQAGNQSSAHCCTTMPQPRGLSTPNLEDTHHV